MSAIWTHHAVEFSLPVVNGLVAGHVPSWILVGIRSFATYGKVSYGTATYFEPFGYELVLEDPYRKDRCHVQITVYEQADGTPVMVVHDVDVG